MAAESHMNSLLVEVAFALPQKQRIVALTVPDGTTVLEAVEKANLPLLFPEVPSETFHQAPLGIFGKVIREPSAHRLRQGDRVEVYRPLEVDPKVARLARAKRQAER
ncbi:MAG: RnfH family protein [Pseudomonadota bacterium]